MFLYREREREREREKSVAFLYTNNELLEKLRKQSYLPLYLKE